MDEKEQKSESEYGKRNHFAACHLLDVLNEHVAFLSKEDAILIIQEMMDITKSAKY